MTHLVNKSQNPHWVLAANGLAKNWSQQQDQFKLIITAWLLFLACVVKR